MELKTKFNYHDSVLLDATWPTENDLKLMFDLDGHWNDRSGHDRSVLFHDVSNRASVEAALHEIESKRERIDVLGIWRDSRFSYLVATTDGDIIIEARSFFEA